MGLFSRKDSATPRKPPGKVRPSVSSEAQAADLRVKARRRLAGAVGLVLAAVVILPMLLDSEPARVSSKIPIKIPDRNAPFQPSLSDSANVNTSVAPAKPATAPETLVAEVAPAPAKPEVKPRTEVPAKPETPKAQVPTPTTTPANRSDDGARAVALLEGRPTAESAGPPGAMHKRKKTSCYLRVSAMLL